jgi:multicomponent K+:H+ antiporter subunit D
MTHIEILPILIPLFGSIAILFAKLLNHKTQQVISILLVFILILVNIVALSDVMESGMLVYQLGNWPAPFGITLVLDQLSAMMILLTSVLALGALWYAIAREIDGNGIHFHVLFQLQLFGINGAFLTGDVFNLFVFFEVLLLASYALLLHGNGKERTKFGLHYVVINLIGSTLFLFAVGTLYGILGTLNIADMAVAVSNLSADNRGVVAAAGLLLLVVFGLKAAMFPLYFWLPGAYSSTSAPVAALFAIMTKVGVYAIIRVHGTIFGPEAGELSFYHLPWVLGLGIITLILGTFGVMSASRLKEQIAYLVLASIATLLIAIGINTPTALSGALYYTIHSTLIAGGFFLYADTFSALRGKFGDAIVRSPSFKSIIFSGSIYFAFAVAITGMPPLSGFFGKMMILSGALESGLTWLVYLVILGTGLGMIVALTRTGSTVFYHIKEDEAQIDQSLPWRLYFPIFYLLALSAILVIWANPISQYTDQSAALLYDVGSYISEVLKEVD